MPSPQLNTSVGVQFAVSESAKNALRRQVGNALKNVPIDFDRRRILELRKDLKSAISIGFDFDRVKAKQFIDKSKAFFAQKPIEIPVTFKTAGGQQAAINKVAKATSDVRKETEKATQATDRHTRSTDRATTSTRSFGEQVGFTAKRFSAYYVAAAALFQVTRAVGVARQSIVDINKDTIRLTQILDGNTKRANEISKTTLSIAKNFGQSGKELLATTILLAQSGDVFAGNVKLLSAVDALAKSQLAPTFGSLEETTSGVVAILNQFNLTGEDTIRVLDTANELAKKFAVEAGDIFTAVQTGGAAFSALGGSAEEFQAVVASVRQLTRLSASTIGTSLNTIVLRVFRPENLKFIEEMGGNIRTANGDIKGFVDILSEVSKIFVGLDTISKAGVIEQLFGIRQGKIGIKLLEDLGSEASVTRAALDVAQNSFGSLSRDAVLGLNRIDVQFQKIASTFEETIGEITRSPEFQRFIRSLADNIRDLVGALNLIVPLVPTILKLGTLAALVGTARTIPTIIGGARGVGRGGLANVISNGGVLPSRVLRDDGTGQHVLRLGDGRIPLNIRQPRGGTALTPGSQLTSSAIALADLEDKHGINFRQPRQARSAVISSFTQQQQLDRMLSQERQRLASQRLTLARSASELAQSRQSIQQSFAPGGIRFASPFRPANVRSFVNDLTEEQRKQVDAQRQETRATKDRVSVLSRLSEQNRQALHQNTASYNVITKEQTRLAGAIQTASRAASRVPDILTRSGFVQRTIGGIVSPIAGGLHRVNTALRGASIHPAVGAFAGAGALDFLGGQFRQSITDSIDNIIGKGFGTSEDKIVRLREFQQERQITAGVGGGLSGAAAGLILKPVLGLSNPATAVAVAIFAIGNALVNMRTESKRLTEELNALIGAAKNATDAVRSIGKTLEQSDEDRKAGVTRPGVSIGRAFNVAKFILGNLKRSESIDLTDEDRFKALGFTPEIRKGFINTGQDITKEVIEELKKENRVFDAGEAFDKTRTRLLEKLQQEPSITNNLGPGVFNNRLLAAMDLGLSEIRSLFQPIEEVFEKMGEAVDSSFNRLSDQITESIKNFNDRLIQEETRLRIIAGTGTFQRPSIEIGRSGDVFAGALSLRLQKALTTRSDPTSAFSRSSLGFLSGAGVSPELQTRTREFQSFVPIIRSILEDARRQANIDIGPEEEETAKGLIAGTGIALLAKHGIPERDPEVAKAISEFLSKSSLEGIKNIDIDETILEIAKTVVPLDKINEAFKQTGAEADAAANILNAYSARIQSLNEEFLNIQSRTNTQRVTAFERSNVLSLDQDRVNKGLLGLLSNSGLNTRNTASNLGDAVIRQSNIAARLGTTTDLGLKKTLEQDLKLATDDVIAAQKDFAQATQEVEFNTAILSKVFGNLTQQINSQITRLGQIGQTPFSDLRKADRDARLFTQANQFGSLEELRKLTPEQLVSAATSLQSQLGPNRLARVPAALQLFGQDEEARTATALGGIARLARVSPERAITEAQNLVTRINDLKNIDQKLLDTELDELRVLRAILDVNKALAISLGVSPKDLPATPPLPTTPSPINASTPLPVQKTAEDTRAERRFNQAEASLKRERELRSRDDNIFTSSKNPSVDKLIEKLIELVDNPKSKNGVITVDGSIDLDGLDNLDLAAHKGDIQTLIVLRGVLEYLLNSVKPHGDNSELRVAFKNAQKQVDDIINRINNR